MEVFFMKRHSLFLLIASMILVTSVGCDGQNNTDTTDTTGNETSFSEYEASGDNVTEKKTVNLVAGDYEAKALKDLTVYSLPIDSSDSLGTIKANETIFVSGQTDTGWLRIKFGDSEGFIYNEASSLEIVVNVEVAEETDKNMEEEPLKNADESDNSSLIADTPTAQADTQTETPKETKKEEQKITIPASFDPVYYANKYSDVAAAFGDNPEALYKHYLEHGKKEGRYQNQSEEPKPQVSTNTQPDVSSTPSQSQPQTSSDSGQQTPNNQLPPDGPVAPKDSGSANDMDVDALREALDHTSQSDLDFLHSLTGGPIN